jgi:putative NADH-flavin reductase
MRLLVLGASGGVGRRVVATARARGWSVRAQTRDAARVAPAEGVEPVEADPTDSARVAEIVSGCDAVVFALGVDRLGRTMLFSDATRALIAGMTAAGVRRLVAITGVGAGETRGHGGWFYDRVIFPLFTRDRYADKDRQEALIRESGLDWVIVRPAPFVSKAGPGPLETHVTIPPELTLTAITRDEAARFVVDQVEGDAFLRQAVFVGRR